MNLEDRKRINSAASIAFDAVVEGQKVLAKETGSWREESYEKIVPLGVAAAVTAAIDEYDMIRRKRDEA